LGGKMAIILKIIASFLGGIALAKTILALRAKEESLAVSIFWFATWLAIIVAAWRPMIFSEVTSLLKGQSTSIGQIAGVGFVLLVFVVYRMYLKAQRLEQKIVSIVRHNALDKIKRPK
jgi:hypothetical protein